MEGEITYKELKATFTVDQLDIAAMGATSALMTMAALLLRSLT